MEIYLHSNLKALRKRKLRSQEDAALALNISRSTYSGYENKVSIPPLEVLIKLAEYFNITIDDLVKIDFASMGEFSIRKHLLINKNLYHIG